MLPKTLLLLCAAALGACHETPPPGGHPPSSGHPTAPPPTGTGAAPTATAPGTVQPTAAPTPTTAASGAVPDKLEGPYLLTYNQTGGIAGLHMTFVLDTNKRTATYSGLRGGSPETKDVTAAEIAAITQALEAARPSTFAPVKGPAVPDAFTYAVALDYGGKLALATWSDGTPAPEQLVTLREAIVKLRDAKFPARPPVSGPKQ
ncbi:MAG: hypothetical protein HY908_37575 [Myxococcales bacterium]|nr:hypothetical protein [Myxococcales bacterium]